MGGRARSFARGRGRELMDSVDQLRAKIAMIALCVVIATGAGWLAFNIDAFVSGWAFAMPGTTDAALAPATFPRMILWLVALVALANSIGEAIGFFKHRPCGSTSDAMSNDLERGPLTAVRAAGILAGVVLYLWSLPVFGFIVTSTSAIVLGSRIVGYRRWPVIIATAVILPSITWYSFRYGMKVILPEASAW